MSNRRLLGFPSFLRTHCCGNIRRLSAKSGSWKLNQPAVFSLSVMTDPALGLTTSLISSNPAIVAVANPAPGKYLVAALMPGTTTLTFNCNGGLLGYTQYIQVTVS